MHSPQVEADLQEQVEDLQEKADWFEQEARKLEDKIEQGEAAAAAKVAAVNEQLAARDAELQAERCAVRVLRVRNMHVCPSRACMLCNTGMCSRCCTAVLHCRVQNPYTTVIAEPSNKAAQSQCRGLTNDLLIYMYMITWTSLTRGVDALLLKPLAGLAMCGLAWSVES